jgi:hypothetical protein
VNTNVDHTLCDGRDELRIFAYPSSVLSTLYVVLWVPFLFVGMGVWAIKVGYPAIGVTFIAGGLFFFAVLFGVPIQHAVIFTNKTGIGSHRFGVKWNFIEWPAIQKIMKVREYDLPSASHINCYYLASSREVRNFNIQKMFANTQLGTILFNDRILDCAALLTIIHNNVRRYKIEIVYIDRVDAIRKGMKPQETKINGL